MQRLYIGGLDVGDTKCSWLCSAAIGARAGGASMLRATARVTFWGALAMALTAGIGKLFGAVV